MLVSELETTMTVTEYEYWIAYLLYKQEEHKRDMKKAEQAPQHSQINMRPSRKR